MELLARFAERPPSGALERPLAFQLADALEAEGPERLSRLRHLGDAALYILGFFEDHLERRGVSRSYAVTIGGHAYSNARDLASYHPSEAVRTEVYSELADGFDDYAVVLDDVRQSTVLRTPQDIVKLYEKYKRTGSPRVAMRLQEEGVFLSVGAGDDVVH